MKKNIPVASTDIGSQEAIKVFKTVKSGWISMGSIVKQFEKNICKYTGAKYAVAMNNGTSTLDALLTIEIPKIEIHLSNLFRREDFRHHSYISKGVHGVICGFGANSYVLAVEGMVKLI